MSAAVATAATEAKGKTAHALEKDPHTGFDNKAHFGMISGSVIGRVKQAWNRQPGDRTPEFVGWPSDVAASIFCVTKREYTPAMAAGVHHEPLLVKQYAKMKADQENVVVTIFDGKFTKDMDYPFLGATPDRRVEILSIVGASRGRPAAGDDDRPEDEDDVRARCSVRKHNGVVETKWKGGARYANERVYLVKCPPYHYDQLHLEMKTAQVPWCDLVIGSNVNTEYLTVPWDCKWWPGIKPVISAFYERYLRWYWENDRSAERMAVVRALPGMTDALYAMVTAQRPDPDDSNRLQMMRKPSNAAAVA